jgi:hypothetical protein
MIPKGSLFFLLGNQLILPGKLRLSIGKSNYPKWKLLIYKGIYIIPKGIKKIPLGFLYFPKGKIKLPEDYLIILRREKIFRLQK